MSPCRICVKGGKSVDSNVVIESGSALPMNLLRHAVSTLREVHRYKTDKMSPDILSKIYWSKFGLLGFLAMTPRMETSRRSTSAYPSPSPCFAVMITLATPGQNLGWCSRYLRNGMTGAQRIRKSFSATRSGLCCVSILERRAFIRWRAKGWTSINENLRYGERDDKEGWLGRKETYMSTVESPTRIDNMRSSATEA